MTLEINNLIPTLKSWTTMVASWTSYDAPFSGNDSYDDIMQAMGVSLQDEGFAHLPILFEEPHDEVRSATKIYAALPYKNTSYAPLAAAIVELAAVSRDVPGQENRDGGDVARVPALVTLANVLLDMDELEAAYVVTQSIMWKAYNHVHNARGVEGDLAHATRFMYDKIGPLFGFHTNMQADFIQSPGSLNEVLGDEDPPARIIEGYMNYLAATDEPLNVFKAYAQRLNTTAAEYVYWDSLEDELIKPRFLEHYKRPAPLQIS